MPTDTLDRIRKRLAEASTIEPDDRAALDSLLEELAGELRTLPSDHHDQAKTLASFTEVSVVEATHGTSDAGLLSHAIEGMNRAAQGFRTRFPRIGSLVADAAEILARMGG